VRIAIDFDGTIHQHTPGQKPKFQDAVPGAVVSIKALREEGHEVIVYTAREDLAGIREWLRVRGLGDLEVTNRKPLAWRYVDDRAIRFEDWDQALAVLRDEAARDPEAVAARHKMRTVAPCQAAPSPAARDKAVR